MFSYQINCMISFLCADSYRHLFYGKTVNYFVVLYLFWNTFTTLNMDDATGRIDKREIRVQNLSRP